MDFKNLTNELNNDCFVYNGVSFLHSNYEKNTKVYHIINQRLLSLRAEGLDLQYKIHANKNRVFIELAFTVFPYWKTLDKNVDFLSRIKKHYNDSVAMKIYQIRNTIRDNFIDFGKKNPSKYKFISRKNDDFIKLVRLDLDSVDENDRISEIHRFISDTYPLLKRELNKLRL